MAVRCISPYSGVGMVFDPRSPNDKLRINSLAAVTNLLGDRCAHGEHAVARMRGKSP